MATKRINVKTPDDVKLIEILYIISRLGITYQEYKGNRQKYIDEYNRL